MRSTIYTIYTYGAQNTPNIHAHTISTVRHKKRNFSLNCESDFLFLLLIIGKQLQTIYKAYIVIRKYEHQYMTETEPTSTGLFRTDTDRHTKIHTNSNFTMGVKNCRICATFLCYNIQNLVFTMSCVNVSENLVG